MAIVFCDNTGKKELSTTTVPPKFWPIPRTREGYGRYDFLCFPGLGYLL